MSARLWLLGLAAGLAPFGVHAEDEWGLGALRDPFAASDPGQDPKVSLGGYWRMRGDRLVNLDLNRGATPSTGETVAPVPLVDPQTNDVLQSADMRLRLEPHIQLSWEVTVHATLDCLDNVVLGSTPASNDRDAILTAGATSQTPPTDSLVVRRAWAEIGTPIGLLTAGRMGVHWGLGLLANSGDCLDCDHGSVVDSVGLGMPLLGHLVGLSYDIASSGPTWQRWSGSSLAVDAEPSDDVRTLSLAVMSVHTPVVRDIKLKASRSVLDYGLALSYRWQENDFAGATDATEVTGEDAISRGFKGFVADGYLTFESPHHKVEVEAAVMTAHLDDASVISGLATDSVDALQYGGVGRYTYRATQFIDLTLEMGLASGDPAPGFGARLTGDRDRTRPGDLDGPQVALPDDTRVDAFRFHPDYRVDLILWRELIGTVTDALYARPSVKWRPADGIETELVVIASQAMEAASTPGGEAPLGVETDLHLRYQSPDRFVASLAYGVLWPLAGLDNPALGLSAEPAQRIHALMGVLF